MKCMILGAVINTVLDPVFIFGLHMGVVGAAIATVIGQVAAGGLCLVYLRRLQSVRIRRAWLRPRRPSRAGFSSWASPVFSRRL